jgi:hypothetical protein
MTADDPVLEILQTALKDQTNATTRGFDELKAEMATTRKWVMILVALAMVLQSAMVGVGLHYSGAGGTVTITPSDIVEPPTLEPGGGGATHPIPASDPLGLFDPFTAAQATTDGTAPLNAAGYEDPEPRGDP